jgi:hypothetical protein
MEDAHRPHRCFGVARFELGPERVSPCDPSPALVIRDVAHPAILGSSQPFAVDLLTSLGPIPTLSVERPNDSKESGA